ncbi:MAG: DoxX family membrane protein [Spirochaetales bacterium]|nr:DoxX family membrane protein [Spirochaetales bacterium]
MQILTTTVARVLFAGPLAIFGLFHFVNSADMSGMLAGWPAATFLVYLTGLCLIAGAVAIISGKMARLASLLLALLMVIFVAAIHLPALIGGDQMAMVSLLKDIIIAGGALGFAGTFKE